MSSAANRPLLLGCIADDFICAINLANNLVRAGMRVLQTVGVPVGPPANGADPIAAAFKSRTTAPDEAVTQSLDRLRWLKAAGAQQIYFKYCSTFDSMPAGNVGPVIDALMDEFDRYFTVATPAFSENGRTVFKGYLFAGDALLSKSGMQNHPLMPMTDANLVRVLQPQMRHKVGPIEHTVIARGLTAISQCIKELRHKGTGIAVVEALSNNDLLSLGPALAYMPLVTAVFGLAIALPANFGLKPLTAPATLPRSTGSRAMVAGSARKPRTGRWRISLRRDIPRSRLTRCASPRETMSPRKRSRGPPCDCNTAFCLCIPPRALLL